MVRNRKPRPSTSAPPEKDQEDAQPPSRTISSLALILYGIIVVGYIIIYFIYRESFRDFVENLFKMELTSHDNKSFERVLVVSIPFIWVVMLIAYRQESEGIARYNAIHNPPAEEDEQTGDDAGEGQEGGQEGDGEQEEPKDTKAWKPKPHKKNKNKKGF